MNISIDNGHYRMVTTRTIEHHGIPASHRHHGMMIDLQKCDLSEISTQQHKQRVDIINESGDQSPIEYCHFLVIEWMSFGLRFNAGETEAVLVQQIYALYRRSFWNFLRMIF